MVVRLIMRLTSYPVDTGPEPSYMRGVMAALQVATQMKGLSSSPFPGRGRQVRC